MSEDKDIPEERPEAEGARFISLQELLPWTRASYPSINVFVYKWKIQVSIEKNGLTISGNNSHNKDLIMQPSLTANQKRIESIDILRGIVGRQ